MEMHERIKELRKKYLKLSQTAFGDRLGVSRSVINNIELNVLARPEQKLSLIKLMCREFNVSEEWLLNGTGDMFASNEAEYSTLIDQIMDGENEFAKNLFKTFCKFDQSDWDNLHDMIDKYLEIEKEQTSSVDEELDFRNKLSLTAVAEDNTAATADTVEDAEAAYIKSRLYTAQKTDLSASNLEDETDTKKASNG